MAIPRSKQNLWQQWVLVWAIVLLGVIIGMPTLAQEPMPVGNKVDGFPVVLDNQTLFRVREGVPGVVTAEERAKIITQRLAEVANDSSIEVDSIRAETTESGTLVKAEEVVLFTIQDADERAMGQPAAVLAENAVQLMQSAVSDYREARSVRRILQGLLWAVLSTIVFGLLLLTLQKVTAKMLVKIRAARRANILSWRVNNFQLLGSDAMSYILSGSIRIARLILVFLLLYVYLLFVLSQFPATQAIGDSLLNTVTSRVAVAIEGFASYLPNLVIIGMILVVTRYVIEFAKLVIAELGRDNNYAWFYPEWVNPTTRLAGFCIAAIAAVIIAPYLPGFGSPAFQGVSLFLGALFTLGSSSAIANAIAGIILIYTRAFRVGDIIRIGDITGKVVEKSLFVTRIARFPQEIVVIPNGSVLSGNVINFSSVHRTLGTHLVLHSTVTLGYDLPWRKVEDILVKAAIATPGILADPSPFVLQTGLNDFNVSYQINAFTDCPEIMPVTYTKLHQNIQDYCNAAGIEIMSPNYLALRDGNHATLPTDYLPKDYQPPGFQVQNQNGDR